MNNELRPFWRNIFSFDWKFGLFLIGIICIPRFILVLKANISGSYGGIGAIMLISAFAPLLFLTKYGRNEIGVKWAKNYWSLVLAFSVGIAVSLMLHWIGNSLYGNTFENWYHYIGRSYNIPSGIGAEDKKILFAVMAVTGMTFSPIGEELFFRGVVHASFAKSLEDKMASIVDASAFALTHIAHFGLVFINDQWRFLLIPTLLWVSSMFLVSILFTAFRRFSNSILGAIICHAGFNLGMIYSIFYLL
ncbi:CPBP family intramembrane glutamic endopeptidase [Dyadobacter tibetensis]|uniref:CPBP family intramembrane glutamic endopeptidase n=1 Tax=Dyadobacter tibetensis TaxID=1211851 RepID=UPI00046E7026|nr:CPBP family intramembrane glutamic endopeptidase [Dyadobacter tibetensis]